MRYLGNTLTPSEVAELLRVSRTTVHRWIADGRLPAHRYSDRIIRIDRDAVEALLEEANGTETVA